MSLKISVYLSQSTSVEVSTDQVRKENKLFLKRQVRKLPDGQAVVIYRGNVHSLYEGNVILASPHSASIEQASVVDQEEALVLLADLEPLLLPAAQLVSKFGLWHEQEGVRHLQFKEDWNLDLREYYSYIVFNQDEEFASIAREILTNPSQYSVLERGLIYGRGSEIKNGTSEAIIYRYPAKDSSHQSFEDRYGDLDFEFRESFQKASDGFQYSYWFRFDPSIEKELLMELAQELFDISASSKVNGLDNHFSLENSRNAQESKERIDRNIDTHKDKELIQEKERLVQQITRLEEKLESSQDDTFLEDLVEKEDEVEGLLVSVVELEKENEGLQAELAKSRITEKLIKSKLDDESRELLKLCFPNVYFLEKRTLRSLRKDYSSKEAVVREAQSILSETGNSRRVRGTTHWLEVTKKISNGTDNQGRLYFCKLQESQVSHAMLISHKSKQDFDIDYLKKHDPPRLDEI